MKKATAIILILTMLAALFGGCGGNDEKITLMVYMVGSDLEAKSMAASNDISEILDADFDTSKVNLLIFTGGSKMWYTDVPNDANATFIVTEENGGKKLKELDRDKANNSMGESNTLTSFLNYAHENYPAEHNGVIFWDHGNGPLVGFGKDTLHNGDGLTLDELGKALEDSPFGKDEKLDFAGFDACLMSCLEVASTLSPYADYLIASQETEPGDGWDYSFLNVLNDTRDTEKIADSIIEKYHSHYEEKKKETFNPDLTLACLDLGKLDAVSKAMDDLFGSMKQSLDGGAYQKRALERSDLKEFGTSGADSKGWSLDMVDLRDLVSACSADFSDEAGALGNALDSFIVKNQTNLTNAGGVSVYYPYYGSQVYAKLGIDTYKTFDSSKEYLNYIDTFTRSWSKDWLKADNTVEEQVGDFSGEESADDEKIEIKLSDAMKKDMTKAYLNIYLGEEGEEYYQPLLYMSEVTPDSNGKITISADEKVPVINNSFPVGMVELSCDGDRRTFRSFATAVSKELLPSDHYVRLNCSTKSGSDDLLISTVDYTNDEDDSDIPLRSGKLTLNSDRWQYLLSANLIGYPKRNSDGALLPFDDWDGRGAGNYYCAFIDSSLSLKMQRISTLQNDKTRNFFYQIVVTDASGKQSLTELQRFPKQETDTRQYTEKTAKGVLTYELSGGKAKLVKYEGKDEELTIPERADGVPVTSIKNNALNSVKESGRTMKCLTITNPDTELPGSVNYYNISKIVLPDGLRTIPNHAFDSISDGCEVVIPDSVEYIGAHAFYGNGTRKLKKLVLPAKLSSIGVGAFGGLVFEEGISFSGENGHFQIKDDMLLSKDGKTLYNYFGKNAVLNIPEGVEQIEPYTHTAGDDGVTLTQINFPSTLKNIRYGAFNGEALDELIIPDSVEEIGHGAFEYSKKLKENNETDENGMNDFKLEYEVVPIKTVSFGKRLRWIGETILGGGTYEKLTVSGDNRFFAARDNRLTTKSGDTDLSEVAMSAYDNLEVNETEYRLYSLAAENLDLSLYDKEGGEANEKSYKGSDYCLELKMKQSAREKSAYKTELGISVLGKDFKLPGKLSELSELGLKISGGSFDDTVEPGKTCSVSLRTDDFASSVYASGYNKSSKAQKTGDCGLYTLWLHGEPVDFSYLGLNGDSTIKDVIKALGQPTEMWIHNSNSVELKFEEYVKDDPYRLTPTGVTIDFRCNSAGDEPKMDSFELNLHSD